MLYLYYGSDTFSRREALLALKQELDSDGTLETNTTSFDARQATPGQVIAACDAAPFFGSRRLIVLEGALTAGRRSRRRAKQSEAVPDDERHPWWALVEYADRMPESTVLVLIDDAAPDTDLLKALQDRGQVRLFKEPDQKSVPNWVEKRARSIGLRIEPRAVRLLADLVGSDTWLLASELDKLRTFAAGDTVREQDVRALVSPARDREGYLLADAVAEGRAVTAIRLGQEMLEQGRPVPVLVLTIENRFRRLAVARDMLDRGHSGSQIGASLRMSGYGLEKLLDQASRYPLSRVRWALARLVQAETDVKRGLYDERLALELLVHDLSSPAGAGSIRAA